MGLREMGRGVWWLVLVVVGIAVRPVLSMFAHAETHDAVEYYAGWSGYRHPIHLDHKITEAEAQAIAARGAYLIGYFDAEGRLIRVVKMLNDRVFFEHAYAYHPNGRLAQVRTVAVDGRVFSADYDERGRPLR